MPDKSKPVAPPKVPMPVVKTQIPKFDPYKLPGTPGTLMRIQDSLDRKKLKNED